MGERVLILAQDLIWADRLGRAVTGAGGVPVRVSSQSALQADLEAPAPPTFVIVDLTAHAYDGLAAIGLASGTGARVLAVGQHDDVPMRKQALAAGADRVLAYRKLFEDGPGTVAAWMSRTAAGARTVG